MAKRKRKRDDEEVAKRVGDGDDADAPRAKRHTNDGLIRKVYSVIQAKTGALGGEGPARPFYGEMTRASFQGLLDVLVNECEFNEQSSFLDIGSGLGKPNLHAAINGTLAFNFGVEIDPTRYFLSLLNLNALLDVPDMTDKLENTAFLQADVTKFTTLNPFTHLYIFDGGMPPSLLKRIAELFLASETCRYVITFQRPSQWEENYPGMEVVLKTIIHATGSGQSKTAVVLRKPSGTAGAGAGAAAGALQVAPEFEAAITLLRDPERRREQLQGEIEAFMTRDNRRSKRRGTK